MNLIVLKVEKQRKQAQKKEQELEKKYNMNSKALAELGLNWDNNPNKTFPRLN